MTKFSGNTFLDKPLLWLNAKIISRKQVRNEQFAATQGATANIEQRMMFTKPKSNQ